MANVYMPKSTDLMAFGGYDYECTSINAQSVVIQQGLVVNDARNNVKIGTDAALFLTTGYNNICFGNQSGYYLTTGYDNFIAGTAAGYKINTSYENCIVGMNAAYNLTSGIRNTVYGYKCGYNMDVCQYNTLIGDSCGFSLSGAASSKDVMIGFENGKYATSVVESVYIGQTCGLYTNGASNVFVGLAAGGGHSGAPVSATQCVYVGYLAAADIGNGGVDNVCIGTLAGEHMATGQYDTYVGSLCGRYSRGKQNVYVGTECGTDANSSDNNVGIGYACMWNGGGSGSNVAIGSECLWSLTDAGGSTRNVAIGASCLRDTTVGYDLVGIGNQAGYHTIDSHASVFIGSYAGRSITSCYNVVAIGTETMRNVVTSSDTIGVGYRAAYNCTGPTNVAIGTSALGNETEPVTGGYNVAIGPMSAQNLTSGENNVISGYQACQHGASTSASVIYGFQAMMEGEAQRAVCLGFQSGFRNKGSNTVAIGTSALGGESDRGTAEGGGVNTITLQTGSSSTNDYYKGLTIVTISGTARGQIRIITAYNGLTRTATVNTNWDVVPVAGDTEYDIASLLSSGTAQGGASSTITLQTGSSAVDGYYVDCIIVTTGGLGAGKARIITAYNGTTKIATVDTAWSTIPDNTTTYSIYTTDIKGDNNVAVGTYASMRATTNYDSIFIGTNAGRMGGGTNENIGIGVESMYSILNGRYNVCLGKNTASNLTTGETNCIIGYRAGHEMGDSAFIGLLPPSMPSTTSGNVCLGYRAGAYIHGPMNICIGLQSGFGNPDDPRGLINAAANILVGYQGDFYRVAGERTGILTKATGNLVIGNTLASGIPPIITGTMPHVALSGDYPEQTACLHFNCKNTDGTYGEIINAGVVATVRGINSIATGTTLSASDIRNGILVIGTIGALGDTTTQLPTASSISSLFKNPFNYPAPVWPPLGLSFEFTVINQTLGNITISANTGVTVVGTQHKVYPGSAGTIKIVFDSVSTAYAAVFPSI